MVQNVSISRTTYVLKRHKQPQENNNIIIVVLVRVQVIKSYIYSEFLEQRFFVRSVGVGGVQRNVHDFLTRADNESCLISSEAAIVA